MTFIHFCIYLIYQTHNFLQIMFSQILNFSPTILNVKSTFLFIKFSNISSNTVFHHCYLQFTVFSMLKNP